MFTRVVERLLPHKNNIIKYFHTNRPVLAKLFVDNENRYAHKILQNSGYPNVFRKESFVLPELMPKLDFKQAKNWDHLSCTDILTHLKFIAKYCADNGECISNDKFDSFIDYFCVKVFDFNDAELLEALKTLAYIPETYSVNTKNFVELWSSLDDACVARIQAWDIDTIHLVCDHWYILNLGKVNKFNWTANKKFGRKIRRMAPKHLVQTMFYCNVLRNPIIDMIDFEVNMATSIQQMSLDEISVMCMGFFKTQTTIKNENLVIEIYNRLMSELSTIEDISFVNIVKVIDI